MQTEKPPPSSWQRKLTPASVSEKPKLALGELLGSVGAELIDGAGGGVPSTLTVGCDHWSENEVESRNSCVVHV